MNNDLSGVLKEADPNEVIEQLKVALKEKSAVIDDLKAERDAYRQTIENILNIDKAPEFRLAVYRLSKITLDQYPSPSKDSDDGTK